jgi:hypothetical protein
MEQVFRDAEIRTMTLLEQANQLEVALHNNGHLIEPEQRKLVAERIKRLKVVGSEQTEVQEPENLAANVFLKITPKKVQPQVFYASHVPSETINELSVSKAKLLNGEWVADEDNVIVRAILPERSLTDMIFNRENFQGTPVTYSEFYGEALPKYVPTMSAETEYRQRMDSHVEKIKGELDELRDMLKKVRSGELKLNKEVSNKMRSLTGLLVVHSHSDLAWELELIAEKVEKNCYHLRSEAIASISSSISQIAEHYEIQYAEDGVELVSPFASLYEITLNKEARRAARALIQTVPEDESTGILTKLDSRLANETKFSDGKTHGINQGSIKLTSPTGGGYNLFGEDRQVDRYFSLNFGFCCTQEDLGTDTYYPATTSMFQVSLSEFQLMSLLQTSFANIWVKGTMTQYMNGGVPNERETLDAVKRTKYKAASKDSDAKVKEIVARMDALLSAPLRSKVKQEEFLGVVTEFLEFSGVVLKDNDEALTEAMDEMLGEYQGETIQFIESAAQKVGGQLTDQTKKLLLTLLG